MGEDRCLTHVTTCDSVVACALPLMQQVKTIKSTELWENMAHMCVKTERLDVAEVSVYLSV